MPAYRDAIESLSRTPAILQAIVAGLPEDVAVQPLDAGWSPKHVVAHLTITDRMGSIGRIRRIVAEDNPALPEVDEEAALRESGLLDRDTPQLLGGFIAARNENVRWLSELPLAAFERGGTHSSVGPLTAGELLFHAAYHDSNHLRQLIAMLGDPFDSLRGPMRAF